MPPSSPPCEYIVDADGLRWAVSERRRTPHGFDLVFGRAERQQGPQSVVLTAELVALMTRQIADKSTPVDLPIGDRAVSKIRSAVRARIMARAETVTDIDGAAWAVVGRLPTAHGMDILMGNRPGVTAQASVVLTDQLASLVLRHGGVPADLPVGKGTAAHIANRVRAHRTQSLETVTDVHGVEWRVIERRTCADGRAVLIGRRSGVSGEPSAILTPELEAIITEALTAGNDLTLPISDAATRRLVTRVRARMQAARPKVTDIAGVEWVVVDRLETQYGIDVVMGKQRTGRGNAAVVLTSELVAAAADPAKQPMSLPISKAAMRRLILASKPTIPRDPAKSAPQKPLRPHGWWRAPKVMRELETDYPAEYVAGRLGISAPQVRRLRRRIRDGA